MLTELARVVEAGFGIPVTVTPLAFTVRKRPGNVLLAEHLFTIVEGCHIGHTRTKSVLAILLGRIVCIVRTLDLEVQTWGNEAHVEFILQVEVQYVGTLVNVSQVIIVRQSVAVVRTYETFV